MRDEGFSTQLGQAELVDSGITPGVLRVSVGLDDVPGLDVPGLGAPGLLTDFDRALAAARTAAAAAAVPAGV